MNLITTSICNKKCSFCFADGKGEKQEFKLDDIISVIEKSSPQEDIKLLGGEPTLYSDFVKLLNYCKTRTNTTVLISNFFIYSDEVKKAILDFQKDKELKFLLNVSETTEKQYNLIVDNIKNLVLNKTISLGFTLDKNRNFDSYKIWLERFINDINTVHNIRVSVPFPNFKEGEERRFYLYKNYIYTDLVEEFIKWSSRHDLDVSLDCGIFPCMFRDEKQKQYFIKKIKNLNLGCGGGAFDIFNKNKASLCYPGKDITVDLSKHEKLDTAFNELITKKRYEYAAKDRLPIECKECVFLNKECLGPCIGFLNNGG